MGYKAMYYRLFNETEATAESLEEIAEMLMGMYFSENRTERNIMIKIFDAIAAVTIRLKRAQINTEEIYITENPIEIETFYSLKNKFDFL